MKKIILPLLFTFLGNLFLTAQDKYLSLHYGIETNVKLLNQKPSIFDDLGITERTYPHTSGSFIFSWKAFSSEKKFALGFLVGIESFDRKVKVASTNRTFQRDFIQILVAFEIEHHYLHRKYFQMFYGFGGGFSTTDPTTINIEDSFTNQIFLDAARVPKLNTLLTTKLNYQFTLLGIRVGSKIGATVELGYGYKGLANFGLFYKL